MKKTLLLCVALAAAALSMGCSNATAMGPEEPPGLRYQSSTSAPAAQDLAAPAQAAAAVEVRADRLVAASTEGALATVAQKGSFQLLSWPARTVPAEAGFWARVERPQGYIRI